VRITAPTRPTFVEMTFAERHPWVIERVKPNTTYIPRRFTNEYCAAHSVVCMGGAARHYRLLNESSGKTYDAIECRVLEWKATHADAY